MDEKLKRSIITKAYKISYYERRPQTDGQYLKSKAALDDTYSQAKRSYLLTSDEKYVEIMKDVKRLQKFNVSETEYAQCVKDLRELREIYSDARYDGFWAMIASYSEIL